MLSIVQFYTFSIRILDLSIVLDSSSVVIISFSIFIHYNTHSESPLAYTLTVPL
jgi:hypothetical protein